VTLGGIKEAKVVIYSHYATTGACEELRDWLVNLGAREIVYVAFPFGHNPDTHIRTERYVGGRLQTTRRSLFGLRLPEPLAYAKDFCHAVLYAIRFGWGADVLVAGDNLLALAAACVRHVAGIRRVAYYMIDYTPVRYKQRLLNGLYYFVDRLAATRADIVWPLTEQIIRGRFSAGRLDERRVRWQVVPYGSHPLSDGVTRDFDPCRVVYMGDVVRSKGAGLFVPFARELRRRVPSARFTVIGGGSDLENVRAEAIAAGLEDVVDLKGFIPEFGDILALLARGAVAVAPYDPHDANNFTFYSDPGKIKVYLGCGLPIVLTDVPPIAQTLVREGAGRIAAYDPADLAEQVAALMRAPEYAAYRANARGLGQRFAWPCVFERAFKGLDDGRREDKSE